MSYAISIETHDNICKDLHQQIRQLIIENAQLRQSLHELRQLLDVDVKLEDEPRQAVVP